MHICMCSTRAPPLISYHELSLCLQFVAPLRSAIFNLSFQACEGAVQSAVNMKGFSTAGCALAVLLVCLLAHQGECGVEFVVGGEDAGWTNTANIDYNKWASNYKVKVGDTLTFVNRDTIDHSFVEVDKLGYDTCGAQGTTFKSMTIGPGIRYAITPYQSFKLYVICTVKSHCVQGMKIFIQIYNADGSVNTTTDATDSPKANSASTTPGFSWTSQLLVATVTLVVNAIPVLARLA